MPAVRLAPNVLKLSPPQGDDALLLFAFDHRAWTLGMGLLLVVLGIGGIAAWRFGEPVGAGVCGVLAACLGWSTYYSASTRQSLLIDSRRRVIEYSVEGPGARGRPPALWSFDRFERVELVNLDSDPGPVNSLTWAVRLRPGDATAEFVLSPGALVGREPAEALARRLALMLGTAP
jgi:hypothetical protein